jgi:hypothetical protein
MKKGEYRKNSELVEERERKGEKGNQKAQGQNRNHWRRLRERA